MKSFFILLLFVINVLGSTAQVILPWDTSSLVDYGPDIQCLEVMDDTLWLGGTMALGPEGQPAQGVLKYDGTSTHVVNYTANWTEIRDFEVWNDTLYLAGGSAGVLNSFIGLAAIVGDTTIQINAPFDSPTNTFYSAKVYVDHLYLGGQFYGMNGSPYHHICRTDGGNFQSVGGGLYNHFADVATLETYHGQLYAGGGFENANGLTTRRLARWNGNQWDSLSNGIYSVVKYLYNDTVNDLLWISGAFEFVNGEYSRCIAVWNDTTLQGFGWTGVIDGNCIGMYRENIFVGGGGQSTQDTAMIRWDGVQWHPIFGIEGAINEMKVYRDELFVAGSIRTAPGIVKPNGAFRYYWPDTCDYLASASFVLPNDTVLLGHSYPFSGGAIVTPGDSITAYNWQIENTAYSTQQVDHVFNTAGMDTVSLTVTNKDGCTNTRTIPIVVIDATGEMEARSKVGHKIWPNPLTEGEPLQLSLAYSCRVSIYNQSNQLIDTQKLPEGISQLNLVSSSVSSGAHWVVLEDLAQQRPTETFQLTIVK